MGLCVSSSSARSAPVRRVRFGWVRFGSGARFRSHDAALVLEDVRVFAAQSLFGSVLLQIRQLFAVDGTTSLPGEAWWVNRVRYSQISEEKNNRFSEQKICKYNQKQQKEFVMFYYLCTVQLLKRNSMNQIKLLVPFAFPLYPFSVLAFSITRERKPSIKYKVLSMLDVQKSQHALCFTDGTFWRAPFPFHTNLLKKEKHLFIDPRMTFFEIKSVMTEHLWSLRCFEFCINKLQFSTEFMAVCSYLTMATVRVC